LQEGEKGRGRIEKCEEERKGVPSTGTSDTRHCGIFIRPSWSKRGWLQSEAEEAGGERKRQSGNGNSSDTGRYSIGRSSTKATSAIKGTH